MNLAIGRKHPIRGHPPNMESHSDWPIVNSCHYYCWTGAFNPWPNSSTKHDVTPIPACNRLTNKLTSNSHKQTGPMDFQTNWQGSHTYKTKWLPTVKFLHCGVSKHYKLQLYIININYLIPFTPHSHTQLSLYVCVPHILPHFENLVPSSNVINTFIQIIHNVISYLT